MPRLLIVEDEIDLLEEIVENLSYEGFDVQAARNGAEGFDAAVANPPDLIITDIMMPVMDGYTLLDRLRQTPVTARVPVVFLTAKADRSDTRRAMEAGADDYIAKPFTQAELLNAIRSRLQRQDTLVREMEDKVDTLSGNILHVLPHELRIPMAGIMGYAELLQSEAGVLDPASVADLGAGLYEAAERLNRLIEHFLAYAQAEIIALDATRLAALRAMSTLTPGAIIESLARQKVAAAGRTADLTLAVTDIDTARITAGNLKHVVQAVLDNALSRSKPGTAIWVTARPHNLAYGLRVTDYGSSLTREQLHLLTTEHNFENWLSSQAGTEVGLLLARRIVELHGGQMTIDSAPQNTTVEIMLPVDRQHA